LAAAFAAASVAAATWHSAAAQEAAKNLVIHDAPKAVSAVSFQNEQGEAQSLADFKGKVVLLNIWATWCGPCRKEMPALDRLQAALGGPDFEIVALSIDRGGIDVVRKFFAEIGIRNLAMYLDGSGQALRALAALGLPATLIIDREGREVGRLMGPAEWDAPEVVEFVRCVISRRDAARSERDSMPAAPPLCAGRSLDPPASGTSTNKQP